jgi:hypothetical protein
LPTQQQSATAEQAVAVMPCSLPLVSTEIHPQNYHVFRWLDEAAGSLVEGYFSALLPNQRPADDSVTDPRPALSVFASTWSGQSCRRPESFNPFAAFVRGGNPISPRIQKSQLPVCRRSWS